MKQFIAKGYFLSPLLAMMSLACMPLCAAETTKPKTEVADLRYGVALYHYYQQDYIPAITELMIADARDGIHGHGDNPELIAAGLGLAFGMQQHSEQLFTHLLQDNKRPESVRDAAWFYLGKLQYARSDWPAAAQSFSKVSENFNSDLLAEMHSLQINLRIKAKDWNELNVKTVEKNKLAQWEPYALYNLGAAHAREGDMVSAKQFFTELAGISFDGNAQSRTEYLTLLDKAHTALGYSYLQEKSYLAAIEEFKKVRLEGIESNQALLGYGWAAIAQEKYAEAIKPWQVLQQRSLLYPAAQESLLALPFAYEKLNAPGDALHEYENAEKLLDTEISLVRDMRATLTEGELLTLISSKPVSADTLTADKKSDSPSVTAAITDEGQNWLKLSGTSIIKTRSIYLRELFAQNEFQAAVLDLRDLLKLQKLLKDWQPKLTAYEELLDQKQQWRQEKEKQAAQSALIEKQQSLEKEHQQLSARIAAIKTNSDYVALADEQTRKTFALVERSAQTIQKMKAANQDTSEYEDKLWLMRGLLLWRSAQEFTANLAALESQLAQVDESLAHIKKTRLHIDTLAAQANDLQQFRERIHTQQSQTLAQLASVNAVIDQRAANLRHLIDQQLNAHEKRLNRYLAQAHLAVARLYDTELKRVSK